MFRRALFVFFSLFVSLSASATDVRSFEHALGVTDIPVDPQRIVSLQDHVLTMTLVELGASVVGSAGRTGDDGEPYLRGVKDLLGVNFDNSDIQYMGWTDLESVAAVEPDLIITTHYEEPAMLEQLQKIAPTVAIDQSQPLLEFMHQVADASNRLTEYGARLERYQTRIEEARNAIPEANDISMSVINSWEGTLRYWSDYGALTQVMDDIGFARPALHDQVVDGSADISAERIQEVDADYIIDTFRTSDGEVPQEARDRMSLVLPGWCDVLQACQTGQYIVLPRTYAFSTSFASLEMMTQILVSHVAGRE